MSEFVTVTTVDDLDSGEGRTVEVAGERIALFNVDGEFHAIDDICTHRGGSLGSGQLSGTEVICPMHRATFDVTTGEVTRQPALSAVDTYEVRVADSEVQVAVE